MAPVNEADAVPDVIGFLAQSVMASGVTITGLKQLALNPLAQHRGSGDFLRMFGDALRVSDRKVLAAGDKPDFELLKIYFTA